MDKIIENIKILHNGKNNLIYVAPGKYRFIDDNDNIQMVIKDQINILCGVIIEKQYNIQDALYLMLHDELLYCDDFLDFVLRYEDENGKRIRVSQLQGLFYTLLCGISKKTYPSVKKLIYFKDYEGNILSKYNFKYCNDILLIFLCINDCVDELNYLFDVGIYGLEDIRDHKFELWDNPKIVELFVQRFPVLLMEFEEIRFIFRDPE